MAQELISKAVGFLNSYNITTTTVLMAAIVAAVGLALNKFSNILIERAVKRRGGDEHAAASAKKVTAYVIYPLTFVAVLGVFGIPLSGIGAAVGLIGLGISFALKDVIANFISGIMILVNRPFKIGDQIKVDGEEGTLQDIQLRASKIRTFDGREVIVPNSNLYSNIVVNYTAYDSRRFEVVVGIDYDDDIETAREIAKEVLEEAETVESDPEPQVLTDELGGSSVNLKLRGWTSSSRAGIVQASSEVTQLIKDRYDEEGIDIPYPIRTVYMHDE